ncbi:MAG: hypothetical protein UY64_C0013G0005 [Parcubacteria group bacterium GW2011_GWA1_51_12]|nr:MAG: hypothetical protein UY64_C0013G0005 [Parcubacteria group bacterium GW2011_GWA1_51_12]
MIYLLYGQDSYRSREKLNEIIGEYRAKTNGVFDFHRFDAEDDATDLLERAGQSASLFQKKKLIVIERPSRGSEAFLKKLRLLAGVWEDDKNTIVVLWDDADKTGLKKVLAIVEPMAAKTQEYSPMTIQQERRWALDFIKNQKLALSPKAIDEILQTARGDTWRLASELPKIALGGERTELIKSDDRIIFAFLDAALVDPRAALYALMRLRSMGSNEQYISGAGRKNSSLCSTKSSRQSASLAD